MKVFFRIPAMFLLCLLFFSGPQAYASGPVNDGYISSILRIYEKKRTLGEWEVMGLAANGRKVPNRYFNAVNKKMKENDGEFRLVTDCARTATAYAMAGKDPARAGKYNILNGIYQRDDLGSQGLNGYVWSLIAIGGRPQPAAAKWTGQSIAAEILKFQAEDGGFSLVLKRKAADSSSDRFDMTCMAITALSRHADNAKTKEAITKAFAYLEQNSDQAFLYSESISQYIIAACAVNGKPPEGLIEALYAFRLSDGRFSHTAGGEADNMATEQALLAMTAFKTGGYVYE